MKSVETAAGTRTKAYVPHDIVPRLDLSQIDVRPETVRHHLRRYALAAEHVGPGSFAVDICSGTGYGTDMLRRAGAAKATGIDFSAEAVIAARSRYPACDYRLGSAVTHAAAMAAAEDYPRPDVVTLFEAIEHIERSDDLIIFDGIGNALAEDGHFFVSTPTDIRADVNPDHVVQWGFDELQEALGGRFESVDMFGQDWTTGDFTREDPEDASFIIAHCSAPIRD